MTNVHTPQNQEDFSVLLLCTVLNISGILVANYMLWPLLGCRIGLHSLLS